MNKTININLSGIVYHINEDAYDKLHVFLESVRRKFKNTDGGNEIIADIESRIAELFALRLEGSKEVVDIADVDDVISIMGLPEDYDIEEDTEEQSNTYNNYSDTNNNQDYRRLFRDPDDKIIGGVSSGLGAYLNIDAVWIRLAFAVLFLVFGTGIAIYLLLWIVIPIAKTTADKLQMRGNAVNIENIEKTIKDEFSDIKDSFNQMGDHARNANYTGAAKKAQSVLAKIIDALLVIISNIFKFVFKILGFILVFIGVISIPSTIFGLSVASLELDDVFVGGSFSEIFNTVFNSPLQLNIAIVAFAITVFVPLILLILLGLRIVTKKIRVNTLTIIIIVTVWFAASTTLGVIAANVGIDHKENISETFSETLEIPSDTIVIKAYKSSHIIGSLFDYDNIGMSKSDGKLNLIFNYPTLDIKTSRSDKVEMRIIKSASGKSKHAAKIRTKSIEYNYTIKDNKINLDNFYSTDSENKFRNQKIRIKLYVPEGKVIVLDNSLNEIINKVDNTNDLWGYQMLDNKWVVTEDGLECLDCD